MPLNFIIYNSAVGLLLCHFPSSAFPLSPQISISTWWKLGYFNGMESLPSSSSTSTTFTQGQLSRDKVQKPMHPSTANYRPLSATIFTPTIQSPPNDTTIDATSATTLLPRHHVRILWGKYGISGSLKIRRFLETMAEEVAVQEGFQYAKILWVLLTKTLFYFLGWPHCLDLLCTVTYKGAQPDEAHWVGEFGPVPGENVVKAHIYVLSRHHQR